MIETPEREAGRHERAYRRRLRELETLRAGTGYAGFGTCPACGAFQYLRGKSYERQRCARCYVNGK